MTTTPETCRCECEECLALRAAEDDPGCGAAVVAFEHDGGAYEIDHLAIGSGSQWGEFAVYRDGEEVAEFVVAGPVRRPGSRPAALPVCADELVRLARQALSGRPGRGDPSCGWPTRPAPGTPASAPLSAAPGPGCSAKAYLRSRARWALGFHPQSPGLAASGHWRGRWRADVARVGGAGRLLGGITHAGCLSHPPSQGGRGRVRRMPILAIWPRSHLVE